MTVTRAISLVLASGVFWTASLLAQPTLTFGQLPSEIRERAADVRKTCTELNPEMKFDDMQGILVVDLKGDGSRDIVLDNEALCGGAHLAGANCFKFLHGSIVLPLNRNRFVHYG